MLRQLATHPEEAISLAAQRLTEATTALENNRKLIERWFWKGLLAFNCVLGSLAFWAIVVRSS